MDLPRRSLLSLALGSAAALVRPLRAVALDYPTRPVHIIVGFPAASGPDIITRLVDLAHPIPAIPAKQPEREVVLRAREAERPAEHDAPDRHPVAGVMGRRFGQGPADLGGQLGSGPLVGVDGEDPVARGQRE